MPISDIVGQQQVLANGYWGYALDYRSDSETHLLYGKPLQDNHNEAD
ncbi:MAG: hypothetical protein HC808_03775 [Candidatus Competibacteraceae bacterium]|nr:hypothetical protein [Candidatus Competibacteraceae bacterium]